jgi:polysaccharide export outer membrane protein
METLPIGRLVLLLALLSIPAAGLIPSQAGAQAMREVLGPGDTIRVTAFRHPELTTEARLSEKGTVHLPLLGEAKLVGMTPDQAASHIAEEMKKGDFVQNPQIGVAVLQARSRQVSVLGFVNKPGRYVIDGTAARVTDVIALAGGPQPEASDIVTVQRTGIAESETVKVDLRSIMQDGDAAKNIEVRGGDSVFVPKAPVFYVYGEVHKGGAYRIEPDMTVAQAISVAGGITPRGSDRRVQMRRKGDDGKWKLHDARLLDGLRPDDVILVRESLF